MWLFLWKTLGDGPGGFVRKKGIGISSTHQDNNHLQQFGRSILLRRVNQRGSAVAVQPP